MTAFDRAWDLMKAPLDFDSIRETTEEIGGYPYQRLEADFIDPETQERLPAFARLSADGEGVGSAYIKDEDDDWRAYQIIAPYFDHGIYPYSIQTKKWDRRKGYQEALLHLIMRLAQSQGKTFFDPIRSMKTDLGEGFAQRMREKHGTSDIGVMEE